MVEVAVAWTTLVGALLDSCWCRKQSKSTREVGGSQEEKGEKERRSRFELSRTASYERCSALRVLYSLIQTEREGNDCCNPPPCVGEKRGKGLALPLSHLRRPK